MKQETAKKKMKHELLTPLVRLMLLDLLYIQSITNDQFMISNIG